MSHRRPNPDAPHGVVSTYVNHHCHCDECRTAWATYIRTWQRQNRTKPIPPHVEHGRPSTYVNYRCKCRPCLDAWSAYQREWRVTASP
jgi:hypothetical protein